MQSGGKDKPCSHLRVGISAPGLASQGASRAEITHPPCRAWSSRLNATTRTRCELQHLNSHPEVSRCKTALGRGRIIYFQCCNSPVSSLSPTTAPPVEVHPKRIKSHPPQPCEMQAKLAGLGPLCLFLRLQ